MLFLEESEEVAGEAAVKGQHQPHCVIHSPLPEGIAVGQSKYGKCLIATKFFPKGCSVYQGCCLFIKEDITTYTIVIDGERHDADLINSVKGGPSGHRQVYGFDGFMNHSCDPNIRCNDVLETTDKYEKFDSIAMKDISIGDEIVCDYALFDYNCDGHEIEECMCGAENCRGFMKGFGAMTLEQQVEILPYCDSDIVEKFTQSRREHLKLVDITNTIPDGVAVVDNGDEDCSLKAARDFEKDELIFENNVEMVTDPNMQYIMKFGDRYRLLIRAEHFIARDGYVEFIGFDTFMNHSCNPTTRQEYVSQTKYRVYAKDKILKEAPLTCDYHLLTNHATQGESIVTIDFICQCGSPNCRGRMLA